MDVQCGVCATEYELDDALLSDRGTVVRCTSCGHQFRVFPPAALEFAAEHWVVFTRRGERMEFSSLRELQHALTAGYLGRTDELARGRGPRRPLGSIAELDGFFRESPAGKSAKGTLAGIAPPPNQPLHPPVPGLATGVFAPQGAGVGATSSHGEGSQQVEHLPTQEGVPSARIATPYPSSRRQFAVTQPSVGSPTSSVVQGAFVSWGVPASSVDGPVTTQGTRPSAPAPAWSEGAGFPREGAEQTSLVSSKTTQVSASHESEAQVQGPTGAGEGGPDPGMVPTAQLFSLPVPMARIATPLPTAATPEQSSAAAAGVDTGGSHRAGAAGERSLRQAPPPSFAGPQTGGGAGSPHLAPGGTLRLSEAPGVGSSPAGSPSLAGPRQSSLRSAGMAHRSDATMRSEDGEASAAAAPGGVSVSSANPRESDERDAGAWRQARRPSEVRSPAPFQDPDLRRRIRSPFAAASIPAEPEPGGHRWMWFAIAALLPVLAASGVFAWKYVQRAREERRAVAAIAVPTGSPASPDGVVSLLEQGRLAEAGSVLERAGAGASDAEWRSARMMLAVARAELAYFRSCWRPDETEARSQAVLALQKAEREITIVTAARSPVQGIEAANLRLERVRSRIVPSSSGQRSSAIVSAQLTDRFARVLAAGSAGQLDQRTLAGQLAALAQREVGFGPVRAAAVEACLAVGEFEAALVVLDGVNAKYRDELWHTASLFVAAQERPADAGASMANVSAPPAAGTRAENEPDGASSTGERLALASEAMRGGRIDVAEQQYRRVLEQQPENSRALTGLAQIARSRGDPSAAANYYARVLRGNPGFMPAVMGRADLLWESGDRSGAVALYRRVLETAGQNSAYGRHATARIEAAAPVPVAPRPSAEWVPDALESGSTLAGADAGSSASVSLAPGASAAPDPSNSGVASEPSSAPAKDDPMARVGQPAPEGRE